MSNDRENGFALLDMACVLALVAMMAAVLLPRDFVRIRRSELIGIALQRIGADLAAAEYVPANRRERHPLFDGSELAVTFVRTALGSNARPGLDVVRVGETTDRRRISGVVIASGGYRDNDKDPDQVLSWQDDVESGHRPRKLAGG